MRADEGVSGCRGQTDPRTEAGPGRKSGGLFYGMLFFFRWSCLGGLPTTVTGTSLARWQQSGSSSRLRPGPASLCSEGWSPHQSRASASPCDGAGFCQDQRLWGALQIHVGECQGPLKETGRHPPEQLRLRYVRLQMSQAGGKKIVLSNRNPKWGKSRQVTQTTGTQLLKGNSLVKPAHWQEPSLSGEQSCPSR